MWKRCFLFVFMVISCGDYSSHQSQLNIVNGVRDTGQFPSVIQIDTAGISKCTATFLNSQTAITAAHCLVDANNIPSRITYNGVGAVAMLRHPNYVHYEPFYDVALIKFPVGSAPATLIMASQQIRLGDSVTMVGYGYSDLDYSVRLDRAVPSLRTSFNTKKYGSNSFRMLPAANDLGGARDTLAVLRDGLIEFDGFGKNQGSTVFGADGTGLNVSTAQGDSGSPLIVNGRVAGVLTANRHQDRELKTNRSYYVDTYEGGRMVSFYRLAQEKGFL